MHARAHTQAHARASVHIHTFTVEVEVKKDAQEQGDGMLIMRRTVTEGEGKLQRLYIPNPEDPTDSHFKRVQ